MPFYINNILITNNINKKNIERNMGGIIRSPTHIPP